MSITGGKTNQLFGNVSTDNGASNQFSGVVGFPANDPISDGATSSFGCEIDQFFGNVCDRGKGVQSSGDLVFLASDPSDVCNSWQRMEQYGEHTCLRDWCVFEIRRAHSYQPSAAARRGLQTRRR